MYSKKLVIPSAQPHVSPEEWDARINLAACYRLVAMYGMAEMIANHISVAVPGEEGAFLINAYGMLYEEITASSLIKINIEGEVLMKPDFQYNFNRAGFVIHSAIHKARPEVKCIIHTHTWAGMAVASMKCGLLPMTQTAMRFSTVGYHEYEGVAVNLEEQARLVKDLGDADALILRNHGLLTVAPSIPEAFSNIYRLELSCKAQIAALSCVGEQVMLPSQEVVDLTNHLYKPTTRRPYGILEWPALLRQLDRHDPSYCE